ncbi:aldose epimerase family protein [Sphingomonas turrisvirgatae]|uniref:Aldose 1-epimerase n=1 Tax=Sphingomonas turrisvirgatae TaxID=1888892 RepID=A0A1E3M0G5_9SPHN|nr:aldose epimerase family protein [Sphingomonas turrisvirgatae]ODP38845.1 galactose mutarotase [Sphingomonas turrisvirgatae]
MPTKSAYLVAAAAACVLGGTAEAATAKRGSFGKLSDGREVASVTLANGRGVSVTLLAYGATIQSLVMPDRNGRKADVALGYDNIGLYETKPQYFGGIVGRFGNRLAEGKFKLDGRTYQTPVNNGKNALHGGTKGFDKVLWDVVSVKSGPTASVTFRYVSRDGEMGYPGTLTVDAIHSLDEKNHLTIEYRATTNKATVVNLTNHNYWNLSGEGSANGAMGHVVTIPAQTYLPTDDGAIPTGEFKSVAGTVFDFRIPRAVGDRVRDASDQQIVWGRGYDHNWVIGRRVIPGQQLMARVQDPLSGRSFELWSNQPGLQFYSGNFFDATSSGKAGKIYRMGDAIVMEPQNFPDAPNQKGFPSARLDPGQTYRNVMTYRLSTGQVAKRKR